jgi:hypothetical protein
VTEEIERPEMRSATWAEIEAEVDEGGYRAGFVNVFLEYRGAILDDMPLDARGRPEVVNQSNFARHFGIANSTFHRWLCDFGGDEFELKGERKQKADEAKGRQKSKASRKNQDAVAQEVRRKVASSVGDFKDKLQVHRSDSNLWWIDCQILLEWEGPAPERAKAMDEYLKFLDEEAEALQRVREQLLSARVEIDATDEAA